MRCTAFLVLLALCALGWVDRTGGMSQQEMAAAPDQVTFTRDVAPIVFARCAPCHHSGGAGPFPLLSYADVRRRARDIVTVTGERVMPPWPPVKGHGTFKGERGLTDAQIATLAQWVEQGATEGAKSDLPAVPVFTDEWQLGTPDLVLTSEEAWTLPAEGGDVFRNSCSCTLSGRRFCVHPDPPGQRGSPYATALGRTAWAPGEPLNRAGLRHGLETVRRISESISGREPEPGEAVKPFLEKQPGGLTSLNSKLEKGGGPTWVFSQTGQRFNVLIEKGA